MSGETTPGAAVANAPAPSAAESADAGTGNESTSTGIKGALQGLREGGIDQFIKTEGEPDEPGEAAEGGGPTEEAPASHDESSQEPGETGDVAEPDDEEPEEEGEAQEPVATDSESSEDTGDEAEDETESSELVVSIPGRKEGETVDIEVSDPEVAERLRQLSNDAMRRSEFNRQMDTVRRERAKVDEFATRLQNDPVGLILEKSTPETRESLVREVLISDEALFEKVSQEIYAIAADPSEKARVKAEVEANRANQERDAIKREREAAMWLDAATRINSDIQALVPENTPDEVADEFFNDAFEYIEFLARTDPQKALKGDMREIMDSRLRLHGITGTSPGSSNGSTGEGGAAPNSDTTTPAVRPVKATPADVAAAEQTRKKLNKRTEKVKSAAAAPGGSGAAPSIRKPPKGLNVKETLKWAKENGLKM